ncbi:hypothetical protein QA596_10135 [Balneolales bacterium ANBcel1]|nr:hypothetical protein [Balneolales bacterium ANBcel1]
MGEKIMTEKRNSIIAGIAFGLLSGLFYAFYIAIEYALIAGPVTGLAVGVAMYYFVTSRMVKEQTQIENMKGESIIRSGGANHLKNVESVGGVLYLLEDRIHFKSHKLNVQNHEEIIGIGQVQEVGFYNTLGIIPNGLSIKKDDDKVERFVVNGRRKWKEEIERLKSED